MDRIRNPGIVKKWIPFCLFRREGRVQAKQFTKKTSSNPSLRSLDENVRLLLEEVAEERKRIAERHAATNPIYIRPSTTGLLSVEGLGCRDNRSLRDGVSSFSQTWVKD